MDVLRSDFYYWRFIYTLVVQQHYQVLSLQDHEVWLTDEQRKSKKVIRLVRTDIDWANHMKQQIDHTFERLDSLRKQLNWSHIHVDNVFVTAFPPVDDWEHLFKQRSSQNEKIVMNSYLLENDQRKQLELIRGDLSSYKLPEDENLNSSQEDYERSILEYQHAVRGSVKHKRDEEEQTFSRGKPIVTFTMLSLITLMFIWLEYSGGSTSTLTLIQWGAKYNPLISDGEWWRLISSMFLHIGFFHLFMNSLALFFLGTLVERIFGSIRFFVVYMVAGVTGSLASFAFMDAVSAGASGAIFGCFGALLYFGSIHRELFRRTMGANVIFILLLNLVLGFMVQGIDMGAHLGGLFGGYLTAAVVGLPGQKRKWYQSVALVSVVVGSIVLWFVGTHDTAYQPETDLQIAAELIQENRDAEAEPYLVRAQDRNHSLPEIPFYLAYIYLNDGRNEEAIPLLEEAIDMRASFHEALYNLALAHSLEGNEEEALTLVEEAIDIQPEEQLYLDLRDQLQAEG
ncbi:rhomboid family intramembrane serine protease [Alkalicoccobacillus porphyridii]|uniref:Rhomboid family intramembrane serine protease n=1 Tax=Alkalicoccobacillus porphyridii TaxID=2597270 RepID=A0A553ZZ46_9BACI|nr:rhomboid family intramembrane serine protease [Alkalicoccobacillus porphyridii]TSB46712.1 rhomboid family intramembrane serine protease [Alkalicoccobacillus porphyridii]